MGLDVNDVTRGLARAEIISFSPPFWIENRLRVPIEPAREFLGDALLFEGARVLVTGSTGAGKTLFCMGLAEAACAGRSFLNFEAGEPAKILYIDYEVGRRVMQDRIQYLEARQEAFAVVCCDDPELGDAGLLPLDDPAGQAQITEVIDTYRPDVVVIDNLYSACAGSILGGDRTSAGQAHEGLVTFLRSMSRRGVCSVLVHHTGHDRTRLYGDSRLVWQMTAHLHLERPDEAAGVVLKVTAPKLRSAAQTEPFIATWDRGTWAVGGVGGEMPTRRKPLNDSAAIALKSLVSAVDRDGATVPAGHGIPDTCPRGVHVDVWRKFYYEKRPLDDAADTKEAAGRKKQFQRARDAIERGGYAASSESGWWWLLPAAGA